MTASRHLRSVRVLQHDVCTAAYTRSTVCRQVRRRRRGVHPFKGRSMTTRKYLRTMFAAMALSVMLMPQAASAHDSENRRNQRIFGEFGFCVNGAAPRTTGGTGSRPSPRTATTPGIAGTPSTRSTSRRRSTEFQVTSASRRVGTRVPTVTNRPSSTSTAGTSGTGATTARG